MNQPDDPDAVGTMTALSAAALQGLGPGTARVEAVVVGEHETLMRLGYPRGRQVAVSVPEVPRRSSGVARHPARDVRLLAVLMRNGPSTLECSVLCASKDGPARVPIDLAEALALCDSGVHTVLRSG